MPHANGPLRDPYYVKLIPTRETAGIVACGFAVANSRDLNAPFIGMWRLWLAPELDRVSGFQQAVLRHEGLHYLQDQFSHSITVRLDCGSSRDGRTTSQSRAVGATSWEPCVRAPCRR